MERNISSPADFQSALIEKIRAGLLEPLAKAYCSKPLIEASYSCLLGARQCDLGNAPQVGPPATESSGKSVCLVLDVDLDGYKACCLIRMRRYQALKMAAPCLLPTSERISGTVVASVALDGHCVECSGLGRANHSSPCRKHPQQ
jgi:hypothetical protein